MSGIVTWIGIRPERKAPVQPVEYVYADAETGLTGDHPSKPGRQVTLIFQEALVEAAVIMDKEKIDPAVTRRNILISGIKGELKPGVQIAIGEAMLEITGPCLPCSRMDETIGEGGRSAMANAKAGGLTANIVASGKIVVGDTVNVSI